VAVIIAVGVNTEGVREVLGMSVGTSEAEPFWTHLRIPRKSIIDSRVIAISCSTAKRSMIPRHFDQVDFRLTTREDGRYLVGLV
jgi:transposase-like protein